MGPFHLVVQPYLLFNPNSATLQILNNRSDGFLSLRQNETLIDKEAPVPGPQNVDPVAWNRPLEDDEALWCVSYLMLDATSELISNNVL